MAPADPIEVPVSELGLSRRFYTELFGWEVFEEDAASCVLGAKGKARILLRHVPARADESNIFQQRDSGILILSKDLEALKEKLRAKRILFRQPHSRKLEIIDPDQNIITVRKPRPESEGHARYDEPRIVPGRGAE
jgi:catechol-2,3-dioxygenase